MSHDSRRSKGVWIITALVVLLLILHQDNWFWNDKTLVMGVMPIGMAWHVLISILASATWALATFIAWPADAQSGSDADDDSQREADA